MAVAHERVRTHWQPVSRWLSKLRGPLGRFAAERSGNVAMLFGFLAIPLMVAIGGAADIGRWLHARSQTAGAVDAAVPAGARALRADSGDVAGAIQAAKAFYAENVISRFKLMSDTVDFTVTDNEKSVTASGTAYIETPFLRLAGIYKLPVLSVTGAEFSKGALAVGANAGKNLEISIMLDVTQSTSGQKLGDIKDAVKDLIDVVIWDDQSTYYSKVALAPFADAVRPGPYLEQVRGMGPSTSRFKDNEGRWHTYKLTECVSERDGTGAYTDIAPVGNDKLGPVYTRSGTCNPSSHVVPLTSDKDLLKYEMIDGLNARGWTAGHLGTAWAWYLLSPYWSDIWPESAPASYDDPDTKKVAILMTDGEYNTQYDAAGIATRENGRGAMNGLSDAQAREICDNIKETGIEVYTVGFDLREEKAIETMRRCATNNENFYLAETGDQLRQAFRHIATKLTPLYLSQ